MTWNPTINANDRPSNTRSLFNTNFDRLKTIIGSNHQFNNSADASDGNHVIAEWEQTATASVTTGANLQTYSNTVNAKIGDLLVTRSTNTAPQDGYNSPISKVGNNTGIAFTMGQTQDILDLNGLTYAHGIISAASLYGSIALPYIYHFSYVPGQLTIANLSNASVQPTDKFSANGNAIQFTSTLASASTLYWAIDFYGISPLA